MVVSRSFLFIVFRLNAGNLIFDLRLNSPKNWVAHISWMRVVNGPELRELFQSFNQTFLKLTKQMISEPSERYENVPEIKQHTFMHSPFAI